MAAGLSVSTVAEGATSAAYLSRLEAGERWPSSHLLDRISEAVRVPAEELGRGTAEAPGLRGELAHADLLLGTGHFRDAVQVSADLADVARCVAGSQVTEAADLVRARALIAIGDTRAAAGALRSALAGPASLVGLVVSAKLLLAQGRFDEVVATGRLVVSELPDRARLSCPEIADLAVTVCEALVSIGRRGNAARVARAALWHLNREGVVDSGAGESLQSVQKRVLSYRSYHHVVRQSERDVAALDAARLDADIERLRVVAVVRRHRTPTFGRRLVI